MASNTPGHEDRVSRGQLLGGTQCNRVHFSERDRFKGVIRGRVEGAEVDADLAGRTTQVVSDSNRIH